MSKAVKNTSPPALVLVMEDFLGLWLRLSEAVKNTPQMKTFNISLDLRLPRIPPLPIKTPGLISVQGTGV